MSKLPVFNIYGQGDKFIEEKIQPHLEFRKWTDLLVDEKEIAFQQLVNNGWISDYSREILSAIEYLNYSFLRICPGKYLHQVVPLRDVRFGNESERMKAAIIDFRNIFLNQKSEALVLAMLTKYAKGYINDYAYKQAVAEKKEETRNEYINRAFSDFDGLINCFNHIFEQFAIDKIFTRNGIVPRQDDKITQLIYIPTLQILADPKWKTVNDDLALMFRNYCEQNYSETITMAHRVMQRFFQILVGIESKNSKGELANLFAEARKQNAIPIDRFTEPILNVFQSYIPAERATKSTAKPAKSIATSSDALLIMNVIMIFLQHCLQKYK